MLLLTAPIFFRQEGFLAWKDFYEPLEIIIPLFFIFLINRLLLVPKLLFTKKTFYYLLSVVFVIAIVTSSTFFLTPLINNDNNFPKNPEEFRPPPPPPDTRVMSDFPPPKTPGKRGPVSPFVNLLVFSFLMIGFDTGLRVSFRLFETEKAREKIEKENVTNQLSSLRNQISPHFFMNTLNNIHSLIDINTEEAKQAIIKLSEIMNYMLYESQPDNIALKREMTFIKSYVELMKIRFINEVDIVLNIPETIPNVNIPPLLSISFIENAFKHGISYETPSFIHINFKVIKKQLQCNILNSDHAKTVKNENSGLGIKNAKSRLDLLYQNHYQLAINQKKDTTFEVQLNIPI